MLWSFRGQASSFITSLFLPCHRVKMNQYKATALDCNFSCPSRDHDLSDIYMKNRLIRGNWHTLGRSTGQSWYAQIPRADYLSCWSIQISIMRPNFSSQHPRHSLNVNISQIEKQYPTGQYRECSHQYYLALLSS